LISNIKGTAYFRIYDREIWPKTGISFSKLPTGRTHIQEYLQFYLDSPYPSTMIQLRSHFIKLYLRGKKKNASCAEHVALTKPMYSVMEYITCSLFIYNFITYILNILLYKQCFRPTIHIPSTDGWVSMCNSKEVYVKSLLVPKIKSEPVQKIRPIQIFT